MALWSLGLFSLAAGPPVAAQPARNPELTAPHESSEEATDSAAAPLPIPASDIPARGREVVASMRRVEAFLEPTDEAKTIEAELTVGTAEVLSFRQELDEIDLDRVSMRTLDDHRLEWIELEARLDHWMFRLQDRWQALVSDREDVRRLRQQWEATRELSVSEELPVELVQDIDAVLDALSQVEPQVRERRNAVALVIDRVSGEQDVARDALSRLAAMAERVRQRALTQDAVPIWQMGSDVARSADVRESMQSWLRTLSDYVEERRGRFQLLVLLFAAFLSLALAFRHWGRSWPVDDSTLDAATFVVSRPVSIALAATLVSTRDLVLVGAPSPVQDVSALVVLVPMARLGVGLLVPAARAALFGVVPLVALVLLGELAPDGSVLGRVIFLAATSLALVGAVLLLRTGRGGIEAEATAWARAARLALSAASALLFVSLLANLAGRVTLARTLTSATIGSGVAAMAWIVAVRASGALLPLLPRSSVGRLVPSIRRHESRFCRYMLVPIAAVATFSWIGRTLSSFQVYEPVQRELSSILSSTWSLGGLELSLGRVLAALVVLVATFVIERLVRFLLYEELFPRFHLPVGADSSIATLSRYAIATIGVLLAAAAVGLTGAQLTVVFGALGVGIGFGLQSVVNNFLSGLILIFERPIKVGDRVEAAGHYGIVTRIGIRATSVRTFDGSEVVVPNAELTSREVINWTRSSPARRVEVLIGVAYGTDPERVQAILLEVARDNPLVLSHPDSPVALMKGHGESSLDFRLLAWTRIENSMIVSSELNVAVNAALAKAGIRVPFPQRDVNLRSKSGE